MLTELRRVIERVAQASSLEQAIQFLVSEVRATMQVDCCSIYQADNEHQHLVLRGSDGLAPSAVGRTWIRFDEGVVGLVARREEPLNIADVYQHPSFKYLPEAKEDSFKSFLGTPIIYHRELLGVLVVQQSDVRSFSDTEEAFLVTLAAHLSSTLRHVNLTDMMQKSPSLPRATIRGIAGASGIGMAQSWVLQPPIELTELELATTTQIDAELELLENAFAKTRSDLESMTLRLGKQLPRDVLSIFEVYQGMLNDVSFVKSLRLKIKQGYSASSSLQLVYKEYLKQFEALSDSYLKERAVDLKDLCQRLLMHLNQPQLNQFPERSFVVVAEEVTATMLGDIPRERLAGIVARNGTSNSHAAILARTMGIPAVMGVNVEIGLLAQRFLIIDGYTGNIFVEPDAILRSEYRQLLRQEEVMNAQINQELHEPAISRDGQVIELLVNAGLSSDADRAESVADGVGLYRTEVPFLLQNRFPSESEQYQSYLKILASYHGKPVCMRTLDVGGDKQLPYFPIHEDNPFLGWRGIRMTLDHPEIFMVQCRAMYRAALVYSNLSIMLPMINSIQEVEQALVLMDRAWQEVLEENPDKTGVSRPKLGVMIEVPSALFILPELAKKVAFWSVGSNDLTQYLLAVDRNNKRVSDAYSVCHPAVIRALNYIFMQGQALHSSVSVCGEMAGDPMGAIALLILGYRHLSMSSFNLAKIRYLIRRVDLNELGALKERLLACGDRQQVQTILSDYLEQYDLLHLVRGHR
ncbi:phosphoenolpyruvate--protein phosphotransferase [Celerinatantimonas diazotrophica]|uniref:phosphoenolpyruvate--protein phosphotransferase n=1 Tax=Celerinatantimonas diazotrophica TaxID=412034 RepID=A0A4R1J953_9GAMM|nr:phosphoenolpyruvate--protein phosphotransferase [Celerinatantimonas diazotrophica]TCK47030.1 phosphotransferase system enzyme I (PtsP) [Celerinatantimonas diazotrophica]CAG9295798.1 Phosphoenolpyruvate-dependent phosphotransferase system [Celerinatantimonas diazotrophica]